ncbi:hypothetical protein GOBAR_AA09008 [Gossypium barbadense]|uniref:MCM C-terminal AAA(+) ATPase domain-containing protein n=1 Tax=Gossypium barbadense TaxID=3634 RepID=A0A2P5Y7T7_GOSBA|nr:hypothetical protein GOBAR_AA09008 [Gossypium barbadense]
MDVNLNCDKGGMMNEIPAPADFEVEQLANSVPSSLANSTSSSPNATTGSSSDIATYASKSSSESETPPKRFRPLREINIRGDLHICLMGDLGVAQSQLLKLIINVEPRGVYTTARGSNRVGLTAAVQKDPVTNEMVLEGGALQYMKLWSRLSVLRRQRSPREDMTYAEPQTENINLPPALLSRFNLLWLTLDRADMDTDLEMARHDVYVHQNRESPALGFSPLEPSVLRCKKIIPLCSKGAGRAQALARLRFSETVAQSDVDEALRLMQMSKFSLYADDRQKSGLDAILDIYSILRDEASRANKMDVSYAYALNWIYRKVATSRTQLTCEPITLIAVFGNN